MKGLRIQGSFKKDLKRIKKRGWNREKLDGVVILLRTGEPLPINAHPHKLTREWLGFWECHIGPNWLLIYDVTDTEIILARTGTHVDLFR